MKRDVRDYTGLKIGELELPDKTSEEVWQAQLAKYAKPPVVEEIIITHVNIKQLRLAIIDKEISFDSIKYYMESLDEKTRQTYLIHWDYTDKYEINDPIINDILLNVGLQKYQLNEFWNLAKEK